MMIDTQIPNITIIETKEYWDKVVNEFPVNDVYYTYEYCQWNAEKEKGQAKLVFFENSLGSVIYPFILRRIDHYTEQPIYDITTPYGYGGPLVSGDEKVLEEFTRLFRGYCLETNIVSEVVRLHPLLNNARYLNGYCDLTYIRKSTAVELSESLPQIQHQYSKMTKRNIKKAISNNLYCKEVSKSDDNIETFLALYKATMNRKAAADSYYFCFSSIQQQLMDTAVSKSHLLFVYLGEKVIAAAILYTTKHLAHYHLGASDKDHLDLRPNNLLFDFMVIISKELNCNLLHLGGGYGENDSLFKYKASFTNNNNYDYYLGTRIYNPKIYAELTEMAASRSRLAEGYFPSYRSV
ncbi:GNAT family N-acetyltransferase [Planococcus sp. ISL-109]|uniref:GNAT family N-acetyltransferase n=1 Tax=Planococcus sp. ISL-109 TaxID=2819166 RepID=UPI001BE513F1|nr:GNAT family N-acetyltransferase [Planococcus sp. ISL-109]MBT2582642.1 GNAT family N-acetyltransferase [Planococcus sp. ISL-109]